MALKDKVKSFFSFLDTSDLDDIEREEVAAVAEPRRQGHQNTEPSRSVTSQSRQAATIPKPKERLEFERPRQTQQTIPQPQHSIQNRREEMLQATSETGRIVIALKYPKKYEDAQEIVDLLIENESILIDFQYMMDAQARRCIDFIDGASKVLFGALQKVGNTMYLLTPANVVVNIDDLAIPNHGQDIAYDYDMKRR